MAWQNNDEDYKTSPATITVDNVNNQANDNDNKQHNNNLNQYFSDTVKIDNTHDGENNDIMMVVITCFNDSDINQYSEALSCNVMTHQDQIFDNPSALCLALWTKNHFGSKGGLMYPIGCL